MARKKTKKRAPSRRRISGVKGKKMGDLLTDAAFIGVGAFSVNMVVKGAKKIMPKANKKFINAAPAALGLFLMYQKNKMLQNAGAGMFAAGFSGALKSFGIGESPINQDTDPDMELTIRTLKEQQDLYDNEDMSGSPINDSFSYDENGLPN